MGVKDLLLLAAFALYSADGRVLMTESGRLLETTAWLPYSTSLKSYPQCCGETQECQMVRISEEVLKTLTDSPDKLRLEFSGIQQRENFQLNLAYDPQLQAASGHASFDEKLYYVAPLSLEERALSPCSVRGQEKHMHLFHKLILLGASSGLAPSLITPLKGPVSPWCCKDSEVCVKVSLDETLLSQRKSIIRIPLPWRLPQFFPDKLESFSLGLTLPPQCTGFCNTYNFRGTPGLSAKVTKGGQEEKPVLSISREGFEYSGTFCQEDNTYVIKETRTVKKSEQSRSIGQDPSLAALLSFENIEEEIVENEMMNLEADMDFNMMAERTMIIGCTYQDFFCDMNFHQEEVIELTYNVSKATEAYMDECRSYCNTTSGCTDFTVWKVWRTVACYLLSDCEKTYFHTCLEEDMCMSGGTHCNATTEVVSGCDRPTKFDASSNYIQWQCIDIEGTVIDLSDNDTFLTVGTVCLLRCNAWLTSSGADGYLFSECADTGDWTTTTSLDGYDLVWPQSPYPLPTDPQNADTLKCNCPETTLSWPTNELSYNPNEETGADFVCEDKIKKATGGITLDTDDKCFFFCDDYLVTEVRCTDGIWSSSLDTGLWCYNKPSLSEVIVVTGGKIDKENTAIMSSEAISVSNEDTCEVEPLPLTRTGHVTLFMNSFLAVCGGQENGTNSKTCLMYKDKMWTSVDVPKLTTKKRVLSSLVTIDGKSCIMGGATGGGIHKSVECYDSFTRTWEEKEQITTAGYEGVRASCAVNCGDSIIITGGSNGAGTNKDQILERHPNGTYELWSQTLGNSLYHHGCLDLGDRIILAGGRYGGPTTDKVFFINPVTRAITESSNKLKKKRELFSLALIDGKIYAVGGWVKNDNNKIRAVTEEASSSEADPTWSNSGNPLQEARYDFGMTVVPSHLLGIC